MKKYLYIILSGILAICSCNSGYDEFVRMIPTDGSVPSPKPLVSVSLRRTIAGGAVFEFVYPDDNNVRGTIATYVRNGETITTKVSRYVDSLLIQGFADTEEHDVEFCTFNVNEVKSASEHMSFTPDPASVNLVSCNVTATYGGVKIFLEGNTSKSDLAVVLLRDEDLSDASLPIEQRKWVEVTTLFTASDKVYLTRRNLEPVEALFAVYVRDHWGNTSKMMGFQATPIPEYKLDNKNFADASLPDDNCKAASSNYPVKALWDGSGQSKSPYIFACDEAPRPCWLTIRLGQTAHLSRIHTLPRIDYNIWRDAHPRDFEFWGWVKEENPTGEKISKTDDNPYGFEEGWVHLGTFTQYKPSGYEEDGSVGTITVEDREYFNAGNDFDLDVAKWPHANDAVRYLRVVFVDNFMTYNSGLKTMAVQIGEITPYGLPVE